MFALRCHHPHNFGFFWPPPPLCPQLCCISWPPLALLCGRHILKPLELDGLTLFVVPRGCVSVCPISTVTQKLQEKVAATKPGWPQLRFITLSQFGNRLSCYCFLSLFLIEKRQLSLAIRGLPYMTSENFWDCLTHSPTCHVQKSADCGTFVCFWGKPYPLPVRTSYMEAP